ncbi:MAG TPA: hypothetical protein VMW77_07940 [Methanoregula sp.]|nr:hypothetical protein [Methanoregula sp.]
MKISGISIIAIVLVVIAVAVAGCSSQTTQTSSSEPGKVPAATTAAGSLQAGSVVTGTDIFGATIPYNWFEYKMSTADMTVYMKYEKSGKCTMRMEGKDLPGGSMTIDCSSEGGQGQQTQSNPNEVQSDVRFYYVGIEPVTVPAGTYPTASKYTVTSQGQTVTYWTASGVPGFVRMLSKSPDGDVIMELNGWG